MRLHSVINSVEQASYMVQIKKPVACWQFLSDVFCFTVWSHGSASDIHVQMLFTLNNTAYLGTVKW